MTPSSSVRDIQMTLSKLFPLCRSITGADNVQTLQILQAVAPFDIKRVPTGARAYDWSVPKEWIVRDAFIEDGAGTKHLTFSESNLHLVNFSAPVDTYVDWSELEAHLHHDAAMPNAIPYRTTYYNEDWGFCLNREELLALQEAPGPFRVCVDTELKDGEMVFGELLIPGQFPREILISTYICHPSLANDNLSGMVMTAFLAQHLLKQSRTYGWTYRVVFVPETVGALAYCALNEAAMKRIDLGFVVTTVGGPGPLTLKTSWNRSHYLNGLSERVIQSLDPSAQTVPFDIHGSDERQYSSPGFRINTVTVGKSLYYRYEEYHSSLDNLSFVSPESIEQSLNAYLGILNELEGLRFFRRTEAHGEPMLSKRNLYSKLGGGQHPLRNQQSQDIMLWILFLSDGLIPTLAIAEELAVSREIVDEVSLYLCTVGLLEEA